MNVQVVTDRTGEILWIAPALPGRSHDLTAARTHKIIRICERQGVPLLADRAYQGAGPWVTTTLRRPPCGELTATQRTLPHGLAAARASRRTRHGQLAALAHLPRGPAGPRRE